MATKKSSTPARAPVGEHKRREALAILNQLSAQGRMAWLIAGRALVVRRKEEVEHHG